MDKYSLEDLYIDDEELDDEEKQSLYELEEEEYYKNVLAPQIETLNRR